MNKNYSEQQKKRMDLQKATPTFRTQDKDWFSFSVFLSLDEKKTSNVNKFYLPNFSNFSLNY